MNAKNWLKIAPALFNTDRMNPNWTFTVESSGAWVWSNYEYNWAIYANPFWEDAEGILIQVFTENDDDTPSSEEIKPFALTGNDEADADKYLDIVLPYMNWI